MINVLIADDQNFVRKTLESYLELEPDIKVVGFVQKMVNSRFSRCKS